ncbi:MAG: alpha/beta hydrolase-fold protein [Bacteroidales bacterium]|jgi:hypothetical protein
MIKIMRNYFIVIILLCLVKSGLTYGQDINIKIGFRDSIKSEILHESRKILIHLPNDYNNSNKSYPVIYRLDGDTDLMLETVSIINRLTYFEEIVPEMIVVFIENTDRARDMLPVKTNFYSGNPGAKEFLNFIGNELIPYIEKNYKTTNNRILCGKSLSGLFTIYAFLTKPKSFNSYIACSVGFPDCEYDFKELSQKAFETDQYNGQKIFITNGLKDPIDPDGKLHQQIADFSDFVKVKLGNKVTYCYLTYENAGHVPFPSFYDGLKYVFDTNVKK